MIEVHKNNVAHLMERDSIGQAELNTPHTAVFPLRGQLVCHVDASRGLRSATLGTGPNATQATASAFVACAACLPR